MKKNNPHVPILIREAIGTEPRVFARYGQYPWVDGMEPASGRVRVTDGVPWGIRVRQREAGVAGESQRQGDREQSHQSGEEGSFLRRQRLLITPINPTTHAARRTLHARLVQIERRSINRRVLSRLSYQSSHQLFDLGEDFSSASSSPYAGANRHKIASRKVGRYPNRSLGPVGRSSAPPATN